MQPVMLPSGAVVIRDEENGSPDTVDVMLRVLRESQARRRILVFSDFSDVRTSTRQRLRDVGKLAAAFTDLALFVGEHGHHGVRGATSAGMAPENCRHITDLDSAAEFLKGELRNGDTVFLKGRTTDHLSRLLFAQFGEIGCWKRFCRLIPVCDSCPELKPKFDLAGALAMPIEAVAIPSVVSRGNAGAES
jgi:UDP-N-acetylmuramyl pentapeptide synthase